MVVGYFLLTTYSLTSEDGESTLAKAGGQRRQGPEVSVLCVLP